MSAINPLNSSKQMTRTAMTGAYPYCTYKSVQYCVRLLTGVHWQNNMRDRWEAVKPWTQQMIKSMISNLTKANTATKLEFLKQRFTVCQHTNAQTLCIQSQHMCLLTGMSVTASFLVRSSYHTDWLAERCLTQQYF